MGWQLQRLRGLGAAVVVLQLVEGTGSGSGSVAVEGSGSGSGTCCSRLRGLGAAVVVLQLVEGSGSGSGTCCSRLKGLGGERERWVIGGSGVTVVEDVRQTIAIAATCVVENVIQYVLNVASSRKIAEVDSPAAILRDVQSVTEADVNVTVVTIDAIMLVLLLRSVNSIPPPHTSGQQPSAVTSDSPSSPAPYIIVPVALIIVVICVMIYFRIRPFHRVRYLLRS
ncbi:hypothetical protein BBBOND_0201120 [Babesia bigemina]|uniref:Uncharacterized protein n=1 Tax=Babesia bigemina TaxID=5866 RepID=A0A061DB49_BABBI|nr:hypothetical protein BBBOND_0201120 [Babesia bigemina]CDR94955.1 hypothetical protein BBBOND_0201120 [Babesia bigemina]|eukprot:XP_012767141.1 hypothetical protein BBBOND_0201120 [Babesia bigemina]